MISKPLKLIQSITDGGTYSVLETIELKGIKNPGLNGLSKINQAINIQKDKNYYYLKKNIVIKPLGDKTKEKWIEIFENNETKELEKLDDEATKCVEKFWDHYGLKINYLLEHKKENTSLKAFTILKAHYALRPIHHIDKMKFKFRGLSEKQSSLYKKMAEIMLNEEDNETISWSDYLQLTQTKSKQLQTINGYLVQKKDSQAILPGRAIEKTMNFRFKAKDLIYNDKVIREKVMNEDIDFALLERERLFYQQLEEVNLKQFILKCQEDKMNYYNKINRNK